MLICEGVLPFQEVKVFRFPGVKARWIGDCTYRRHGSPEWCGATQRRWVWIGSTTGAVFHMVEIWLFGSLFLGEKVTSWKINMEPTHYPFLKGKSYGGVCNRPENWSPIQKTKQDFMACWKIMHGYPTVVITTLWATMPHRLITGELRRVAQSRPPILYFFMRALKYLSKPCASKGCIWHSLAYTRYGRGRWGQSFIITTYDMFLWRNIIHARGW